MADKVPAICATCWTLYESVIPLGTRRPVRALQGTSTCPACGGQGTVLIGDWIKGPDGRARLVDGPPPVYAILDMLKALKGATSEQEERAREAAKGGDVEAFAASLDAIAPGIGAAFRALAGKMSKGQVAALLLLFVALTLSGRGPLATGRTSDPEPPQIEVNVTVVDDSPRSPQPPGRRTPEEPARETTPAPEPGGPPPR